jgi:3-deoxy-D-manno-octulosonate 8-phosphate phosphatase (KDO 8-P phosphatase)
MGDDVIDLPVMTKVGFAIAVANAHDLVKQNAHLVTQKLKRLLLEGVLF